VTVFNDAPAIEEKRYAPPGARKQKPDGAQEKPDGISAQGTSRPAWTALRNPHRTTLATSPNDLRPTYPTVAPAIPAAGSVASTKHSTAGT
jgi:hypothetical protein